MLRLALTLPMLLAVGCATHKYAIVDGKRVERPSVAYGSDEFWIEHDRAFPGVFNPKRGLDVDDGVLHGKACGVDVNFDASWYRARLHLDGRGSADMNSRRLEYVGGFAVDFEVTELGPGRRHIMGKVPIYTAAESAILDIDVSPDRLVGRIGMRQFTLGADGEYLAGTLERHGDVLKPINAPYAIYGRRMLAGMVPADEALVLLMMMTCNTTVEYDGNMVRGFSLVTLPPKS